MQVIKEEGKRPIKAWIGLKEMELQAAAGAGHEHRVNGRISDDGRSVLTHVPDIEDSALVQLKNLAGLP